MNPWYCFSVKSSLLTRLFLHRAALQRWTPNGHNLIKFKILSFCLNTESKLKSVLFNRPHPLWIKCMQTKLFSPALHRQWSHPFSTTHRGILITKKQISFAVTQVFNNKKKKKNFIKLFSLICALHQSLELIQTFHISDLNPTIKWHVYSVTFVFHCYSTVYLWHYTKSKLFLDKRILPTAYSSSIIFSRYCG